MRRRRRKFLKIHKSYYSPDFPSCSCFPLSFYTENLYFCFDCHSNLFFNSKERFGGKLNAANDEEEDDFLDDAQFEDALNFATLDNQRISSVIHETISGVA